MATTAMTPMVTARAMPTKQAVSSEAAYRNLRRERAETTPLYVVGPHYVHPAPAGEATRSLLLLLLLSTARGVPATIMPYEKAPRDECEREAARVEICERFGGVRW